MFSCLDALAQCAVYEVHEFLICALAPSSSFLCYFMNIQQFIHSTGSESFPYLLPVSSVCRLFNVSWNTWNIYLKSDGKKESSLVNSNLFSSGCPHCPCAFIGYSGLSLTWPDFKEQLVKNLFPHLLRPSSDCQCLNSNWYNPIQELKAIVFGLFRLVTESQQALNTCFERPAKHTFHLPLTPCQSGVHCWLQPVCRVDAMLLTLEDMKAAVTMWLLPR